MELKPFKVLRKDVMNNTPDVIYESMGECSREMGHDNSWACQTFRRHDKKPFYHRGFLFSIIEE